jgi:cyclophilin family peptidyl-prolyl cis-trans isomerase
VTSDPNRPRPRSSKKRRAVQTGGRAPSRPAGQPVRGTTTRRGAATPQSGGIPGAWLAIGAVVVFAVGVLLASGTIQFGAAGSKPSGSADPFGYDASGSPAASAASPGGSAAGSIGSPTASGPSASGSPSSSTTAHGTNCPTAQPPAAPAGSTSVVTIETPKGSIELTLKADLSPIAVGNFLALARCGYYDNVVFHRVVPNFVIQGGDGQYARADAYDPNQAGTGGPGYTIQDEPVTTQYSRGTVAMARTPQPNSVGSQFFIVLSDDARSSLASANTYQILGSVTQGMEVADAIAAAADGENPSQPIPMTMVTVAP